MSSFSGVSSPDGKVESRVRVNSRGNRGGVRGPLGWELEPATETVRSVTPDYRLSVEHIEEIPLFELGQTGVLPTPIPTLSIRPNTSPISGRG